MSLSSTSQCSVYSITPCCVMPPYNVMVGTCVFLLLFVLELNLQCFAKMKIHFSLRYLSLWAGRQSLCLAYRLYNRYSPNVFFCLCIFSLTNPKAVGSMPGLTSDKPGIMQLHSHHLLPNTFFSFSIMMTPQSPAQGNNAERIRKDTRRRNIFLFYQPGGPVISVTE